MSENENKKPHNENQLRREAWTNWFRKRAKVLNDWVQKQTKTGFFELFSQLFNAEPVTDYQDSPEYLTAKTFWNEFKEEPEVDYTGVIAYARELFESCEQTNKTHEEKADSIIKYLGGGTALITFGALVSVKTDTIASTTMAFWVLICLIPSLLFAMRALGSAIRARMPASVASLKSVEFAVQMAEYNKDKDKTDLNLWLMLHPICESYQGRNAKKAELVKRAHRDYLRAIALLSVPLLGAIITLGYIRFG